MEIKKLALQGVYEITLKTFEDERGSFTRIYDETIFNEFGIPGHWVQENRSKNKTMGTIRGLHFLLQPHTDGKLICCIRGKIWDVIVDLRKGSPSLGSWISAELCETDNKWIYVPKGFAHGFCTLTDNADLLYKHDSFYHQNSDCGIVWNDKEINIQWPVIKPIISEKDKKLMTYNEFINTYKGL